MTLHTNLHIIMPGIRTSRALTSIGSMQYLRVQESESVAYCKKTVMVQETRYFDCASHFLLLNVTGFVISPKNW